jgi:large subunit ribosomal protein L17
LAVIEFVDRDVDAKKVDIKKKTTTKDTKEEKKLATA